METQATEIQTKLKQLDRLFDQKALLATKTEVVEEEINVLLGQLQIRKGSTAKKKTLGHGSNLYITKVCAPGAHMKTKEIAAKLLEAGYQTTNKKFPEYVSIVLRNRIDMDRIRYGVWCRKPNLEQK